MREMMRNDHTALSRSMSVHLPTEVLVMTLRSFLSGLHRRGFKMGPF